MTFEVRWSGDALDDLIRLHDFLLEKAETLEELSLAERAIEAIEHAVSNQLARSPYIFRRAAGMSPAVRELIIPFGSSGYLARYVVRGDSMVVVLGVRHQRQQDYL